MSKMNLLQSFLRGKKTSTITAYRSDLTDFAAWLECITAESALEKLFRMPSIRGNRTIEEYAKEMKRLKLATRTINRRLSTLRSVVKFAHASSVMGWTVEARGQVLKPTGDAIRPELVKSMVKLAYARKDAHGIRDAAIISLLAEHGLRRSEVSDLNLHSFADGTFSKSTTKAMAKWLVARSLIYGTSRALFVALDRAQWGRRLTPTSIYRIVRGYGKLCGQSIPTHKIRGVMM